MNAASFNESTLGWRESADEDLMCMVADVAEDEGKEAVALAC
jgi:hypothetical protein